MQAAALNQVIAFNDETMINQDQFYHLLVGFDLLYSGLMAPGSIDEWDLSRRKKNSMAGFIFKQYKLLESGPLYERREWSSNTTQCGLTAQSNYRLFKNAKNKRLLYINFCWGTNFTTLDFDKEWVEQWALEKSFTRMVSPDDDGPLPRLRNVLCKLQYDQLILSGHSMGAGLIFMLMLKFFLDPTKYFPQKAFGATNIFINFFGLGRLPTRLCKEFFELHKKLKFNVLDFLTFSGTEGLTQTEEHKASQTEEQLPYFDNYIDEIMVRDVYCNYKADPWTHSNPVTHIEWGTGISDVGIPSVRDGEECEYGCGFEGSEEQLLKHQVEACEFKNRAVRLHAYYCRNTSPSSDLEIETPLEDLPSGDTTGCRVLNSSGDERVQCSLYGKYKPFSEVEGDKDDDDSSSGQSHLASGEYQLEGFDRGSGFSPQRKLIYDIFGKEIPEKYQDCYEPRRWGTMYSDQWNECQDFFDAYHRHNDINTFVITRGGNINALSKNTALRDYKVRFGSPIISSGTLRSNPYHALETYHDFFKKNDLINALNQLSF